MAAENKNKKNETKKPRPNYYWIYAAVILLFFGIQIFGGSSWSQPAKTSQAQFEEYLRQGDVEKVDIINKKIAKVYLTDEAKARVSQSKKSDTPAFMAPGPNDADFQFEFGDLQNFENSFQQIKQENGLATTMEW